MSITSGLNSNWLHKTRPTYKGSLDFQSPGIGQWTQNLQAPRYRSLLKERVRDLSLKPLSQIRQMTMVCKKMPPITPLPQSSEKLQALKDLLCYKSISNKHISQPIRLNKQVNTQNNRQNYLKCFQNTVRARRTFRRFSQENDENKPPTFRRPGGITSRESTASTIASRRSDAKPQKFTPLRTYVGQQPAQKQKEEVYDLVESISQICGWDVTDDI